MSIKRVAIFVLSLIFLIQPPSFVFAQAENESPKRDYAGSVSCRSCHERFYELWAPSHHGLAMQPYTPELAEEALTGHKEAIKIGETSFLAEIGAEQGWVRETGPEGEKKYPIVHVMGGKN
ncbi:MAG: hypothetical protein ACYTE8_11570, partial [Planctomycetota bacterium]